MKRPRPKPARRKAAKHLPSNQAARRKRKLKPKPSQLDQEWKNHQAARKIHNLSTRFVQLMSRLRAAFDACGAANQILLLAVDNSF